jgi:hypothetical protein
VKRPIAVAPDFARSGPFAWMVPFLDAAMAGRNYEGSPVEVREALTTEFPEFFLPLEETSDRSRLVTLQAIHQFIQRARLGYEAPSLFQFIADLKDLYDSPDWIPGLLPYFR